MTNPKPHNDAMWRGTAIDLSGIGPRLALPMVAPDAIDIPCAPLDGNGTVCIFCRMEMHSECDRTDCECCGGKQ